MLANAKQFVPSTNKMHSPQINIGGIKIWMENRNGGKYFGKLVCSNSEERKILNE